MFMSASYYLPILSKFGVRAVQVAPLDTAAVNVASPAVVPLAPTVTVQFLAAAQSLSFALFEAAQPTLFALISAVFSLKPVASS